MVELVGEHLVIVHLAGSAKRALIHARAHAALHAVVVVVVEPAAVVESIVHHPWTRLVPAMKVVPAHVRATAGLLLELFLVHLDLLQPGLHNLDVLSDLQQMLLAGLLLHWVWAGVDVSLQVHDSLLDLVLNVRLVLVCVHYLLLQLLVHLRVHVIAVLRSHSAASSVKAAPAEPTVVTSESLVTASTTAVVHAEPTTTTTAATVTTEAASTEPTATLEAPILLELVPALVHVVVLGHSLVEMTSSLPMPVKLLRLTVEIVGPVS